MCFMLNIHLHWKFATLHSIPQIVAFLKFTQMKREHIKSNLCQQNTIYKHDSLADMHNAMDITTMYTTVCSGE